MWLGISRLRSSCVLASLQRGGLRTSSYRGPQPTASETIAYPAKPAIQAKATTRSSLTRRLRARIHVFRPDPDPTTLVFVRPARSRKHQIAASQPARPTRSCTVRRRASAPLPPKSANLLRRPPPTPSTRFPADIDVLLHHPGTQTTRAKPRASVKLKAHHGFGTTAHGYATGWRGSEQ